MKNKEFGLSRNIISIDYEGYKNISSSFFKVKSMTYTY